MTTGLSVAIVTCDCGIPCEMRLSGCLERDLNDNLDICSCCTRILSVGEARNRLQMKQKDISSLVFFTAVLHQTFVGPRWNLTLLPLAYFAMGKDH